jgi:cell division protein FtsL
VWQHVRSSELALEIEALKGRREAVKTEIGLLEMECAELSGRKRVEEYATERLEMRYPRAGEVIWIGPSDSGGPIVDREGYVVREAACETKG